MQKFNLGVGQNLMKFVKIHVPENFEILYIYIIFFLKKNIAAFWKL
jgi:hypothetical protein